MSARDTVAVLGIDIGGGTGYCLGVWEPGKRKAAEVHAWQCDQASADELLGWILVTYLPRHAGVFSAQAEAYRAGPRSVRTAGMAPGAMHGQVAQIVRRLDEHGVPCGLRAAADVKKWASDERLREAGLLDAAHKTGRHAVDGARHCLFRAVSHLGVPDPLSTRSAG